ncbi:Uncharacterised protein [Mycobacteroides abscessus subsp. abscessus]|nr:Uncharacterised protein [Mycobacteroides abscessus subsp. abscessus]
MNPGIYGAWIGNMLQSNDISLVNRLRDDHPTEHLSAVMRCCPARYGKLRA